LKVRVGYRSILGRVALTLVLTLEGSGLTSVRVGAQVVIQGIPWAYTDEDLQPLFEGVGEITLAEVQIGKDGRSRGYGTVGFKTTEEAQAAIEKVHGTELEGRTLTVKLDRFA